MIECRYQFLPDKFYLACSGGIDSISVAHFLARKNKNITLFHFNHHVSSDNDLMQEKVEKFAQNFSIPLIVKNNEEELNIKEEGLESACRSLRMKAYRELDNPIVVCHHLNDCIESYMMNCLRGHPNYIPIPVKTKLKNSHHYLIRPFLLTLKKELIKYAKINNLNQFIFSDPMNFDLTCQRNWIRKILLPTIELEYKGLTKVVRKIILQGYQNEKI